MSNRPTLGVSTLVMHGGKVLLVKRSREPLRGLWSLPGGHVEAGESLADAALREVREETGIVADKPERIDVVEVIPRDAGGGIAAHFVLVVFRARYVSGEPVAADDAAEARWVNAADLTKLAMTEEARRMIERHGKANNA
jgi:ADP-ribose pyrophosphatase YjhB (NUDIX family)